MYLKDITNMISVILHLNVSRLSVCISCYLWLDDLVSRWYRRVLNVCEVAFCGLQAIKMPEPTSLLGVGGNKRGVYVKLIISLM